MHIYKSQRYRRIELLLRWQRHPAVQWLLRPSALCYRLVVGLRVLLYRYLLPRQRLPATTISVGNIVSGGSGKTPIVIAIGQQLIARGERVVILSRGYGSSLRRYEFVVLQGGKVILGKQDVQALDEARLLSQAMPQAVVIAAAHRYAALKNYLSLSKGKPPTYFLLDDGFQHLHLQRDLDIVLLDATRPFADEQLLPCGMLREPRPALRRAQLALFTRATADAPSTSQLREVQELVPHTASVRFSTPALQSAPTTQVPFTAKLNPVLFICGIANPARALAAVQHLGVQVRIALYLADHEAVKRDHVRRLAPRTNAIVMTAKDYWRDYDLYAQQPLPVFIMAMTTDFDFSQWQGLAANTQDRGYN